jgi:hypothetical protein
MTKASPRRNSSRPVQEMAKTGLQLCRVVRMTLKTKAKILNGKVEEKTAQLVVVEAAVEAKKVSPALCAARPGTNSVT